MKTKMLFVVHGSAFGIARGAGLIQQDATLPVAFSDTDDCCTEELGFAALWESERDVEVVFDRILKINSLPEGPGLYVVEAEFSLDGEQDLYEWEHLAGCQPRRVTDEELLAVTAGQDGWRWA